MKNEMQIENTYGAERKNIPLLLNIKVNKLWHYIAENRGVLLRNLSITFTVFVIFVLGYYILFPAGFVLHADSVDTLMWAQASFDGGAIYNPDFTYAALLPFGGQLIMLPLIAVFGVGMASQTLGMLIFFAIFVAAILFMLKQLNWGLGWRSFAVACMLLVLSVSEKLREIFWGHIIYYSLGLFFMFVGMGLIFKAHNILKDEGISRKFRIFVSLTFVWFTLTAINQLEALTLFLIPAIGALIGERFFSFKNTLNDNEKQGNFILIAVTILGTVVGYLIGNILKGGLVAGYADAYSTFSSPSTWMDHLNVFLSQWTSLLGVTIADGDRIFSADGVMNLLRIISSLTLIIAPIVATLLYPKIKDRASRILILFHWIMTTLIMMGFIFGDLSAANWRLSPIVGTCVLITIILCRWIYKNTEVKRLILIIVLPILIIGLGTIQTIAKLPSDYKQHPLLSTVAGTLEENNLTYGYATFWNANVLTVLSNSEIKVRNINIEEAAYTKGVYQSQGKWFEDQPGQESYFVLATAHEYDLMKKSKNQLITKAQNTIPIKGYYILVYDENIF